VILELLFLLLAAHVFADFVFQSDVMAKLKSRHNKPGRIPNGHKNTVPSWPYWLTAHAIVHGAVVFYVTQSLMLGVAEIVLHWWIDYAKCESKLNISQDQMLHILCKFCYCVIEVFT